jgi:hypothetical protein
MASSTRIPSFVPSIVDVSSAPKHTGHAKTLELAPITIAAAVATMRLSVDPDLMGKRGMTTAKFQLPSPKASRFGRWELVVGS